MRGQGKGYLIHDFDDCNDMINKLTSRIPLGNVCISPTSEFPTWERKERKAVGDSRVRVRLFALASSFGLNENGFGVDDLSAPIAMCSQGFLGICAHFLGV